MFRHPSPTTTATHFNSQEKARTHLSGAAKPWCKPLCGFWVCVGEQWDPPQHSTPPQHNAWKPAATCTEKANPGCLCNLFIYEV